MNKDHQPVILAETKFLRLIQDGSWTYAQRPHAIGAIAVAAVTSDRELVLVQQYRIPVRAQVVELPAGLVGDSEANRRESMVAAARRELLEETGYVAAEMRVLTQAVSSGGLTDETVALLLAEHLRRVGAGGGDDSEQIRVHHVPLDEVAAWLTRQQQAGLQVDYKVYAALYFLLCRSADS